MKPAKIDTPKAEVLAPPPDPKAAHPEVTSFAVIRRDKRWHCVATKSKGREIVDERVLGSFDWQDAACDCLEQNFRRTYLYGLNVWALP